MMAGTEMPVALSGVSWTEVCIVRHELGVV